MAKFKVGDMVVHSKFGTGEVLYLDNDGSYLVGFDKRRPEFHNGEPYHGDWYLKKYTNSCFWISEENLSLAPTRILIYANKNTVVAKDLNSKNVAVAKCSHDDTFDFYIGAQIALLRLLKGVK